MSDWRREIVTEEWTKWEPLKGALGKMYLEKLVDDKNGTLLFFKRKDDDNTLEVFFEGSILSLRSTDEGRRIKTINFLDEKYGTDFYAKWTFFKVANSSYVEWFNQETYNMYVTYDVKHYVFLTPDDVIEILSTYEPNMSISVKYKER